MSEILQHAREILTGAISILLILVVYFKEARKNNLELLLSSEYARRKHDMGIVLGSIAIIFALNVEFGIICAFSTNFINTILSLCFVVAFFIICYLRADYKERKNKISNGYSTAFSILFLVVFGFIVSNISFTYIMGNVLNYQGTLGQYLIEQTSQDSAEVVGFSNEISIISKVCKANYFNACLILSVLEGGFIATQLLNVSNRESIIKLHLFDDDGEVLPEMYVYSRIGNNFLVGNEPNMRNASEVHKVKLEDIDSNIKTFFSYVPIPEKEKIDKNNTYKFKIVQLFHNKDNIISENKGKKKNKKPIIIHINADNIIVNESQKTLSLNEPKESVVAQKEYEKKSEDKKDS